MAMRKPTFFEKWGLVAFFAVGMVYGYLELVQKPVIARYEAVVKKNNELVQQINALGEQPQVPEAYERRIEKTQAEIEQLKKKLQALKEQTLTPRERIEETVMLVSELAANNYLRVGSIAPPQGGAALFASLQKDQKILERNLYSMRLQGDFVSFYRFVEELSELSSVINVSQITMVGKDAEGHIEIDLLLII